ncbi:hypothetical protein AKJ62_04165, partial [candidate division MSBL1 archaeon SCGC-AAA259D14]
RVKILKDVVRHPSDAFRKIGENGRKYLPGALTIFVFTFLFSYFLFPILFLFRGILMGGFTILLYIVLIYLIGKVLGGEAEFAGLVSAMGYAYIPSVFMSFLFRIGLRINIETIREVFALQDLPREQIAERAIPLLKDLITPFNVFLAIAALLLGIWGLILTVLACRETHRFETGKAIGTIILTMFAAGAVTSLLGFLT